MAEAGTQSGTREVGSRIAVVVRYVVYVALPVHLVLLVVFALTGVYAMAYFNVWSVAMWIGAWVANSRNRPRLASMLLNVEVSAHAIAAVSLLGLRSGFQYYLVPIIALPLFNDHVPPRRAIVGSAAVVLLFVAVHYVFADVPMHPGWAPIALPFEVVNILTALSFVSIICAYFRFASIDIENKMEDLASSLERRVEEQVAEIVAHAGEVESLNKQLKAQVKARSDELAVALARLAQQPEAGGLRPGSVVDDRFEVAQPIGAGGMGVVYSGRDRTSGKRVAIKIVRTGSSGDLESLRRFVREAGAAATVPHPAVVKMVHLGLSDEGLLYQVQELVDGVVLSRCVGKPWAPADAARLGAVLLEALAAAHANGVVHRDVKTENLMLTAAAPGLKLLDFGIAKLYDAVSAGNGTMTHTGHLVGTPAFMAPEQARGDSDVGARADVYAAGTVLYLLLTARLPFEKTASPGWFLMRAIEDAPDLREHAPETPEPLAKLVMACLAREPGERPAAADAARSLAAFADANGARKLETMSGEMETFAGTPMESGVASKPEGATAAARPSGTREVG
ncbi:MAG: serine/threonine-protein kinase [Sandaracinus sp.]